MTPPRAVLESWRALATAQLVGVQFGRHTADLDRTSAEVRAACHELAGPDRHGVAYDRLVAYIEAAHRGTRLLCDEVEALCDAGTRTLSALYYTAQALLDCVADAEDTGCLVADDWSVLPAAPIPDAAQTAVAEEWAEVIAEGVRAVDRADERSRVAVRDAGLAIAALSAEFDRLGLFPAAAGALAAGVRAATTGSTAKDIAGQEDMPDLPDAGMYSSGPPATTCVGDADGRC
ncbi:hypothetical protein [Nocardia stercoris]|uniref:Uncharacterized protein n=1 Tax=Nocardia stercoris TaxID=2483361 RepID=A0A3M2L2B5_9NOCA|nr:hypothetical protein [Nocardia stercoris]RMI31777.1 hypothetical protein EBN03_16430 [Nocardia stercoris]